jgi:hypothetical protein
VNGIFLRGLPDIQASRKLLIGPFSLDREGLIQVPIHRGPGAVTFEAGEYERSVGVYSPWLNDQMTCEGVRVPVDKARFSERISRA